MLPQKAFSLGVLPQSPGHCVIDNASHRSVTNVFVRIPSYDNTVSHNMQQSTSINNFNEIKVDFRPDWFGSRLVPASISLYRGDRGTVTHLAQ